jgi:hypothetical protein
VLGQLRDAATRVTVAFVYIDGRLKPKPMYLGEWGVVEADQEGASDGGGLSRPRSFPRQELVPRTDVGTK